MNNQGVRKRKRLKRSFYVVFNVLLIAIFALSSFSLLKYSMMKVSKYKLNYSETSNIDYNVCLKENSFYEEECLGKNMKYVASLINKIRINIDYIFTTNDFVYSDYTHKVVGKIIISDPTNDKNVIFSKNYDLGEQTNETIDRYKIHNINKLIEIDYDKYNNLANQFKSTYGVSSNARLEVHLIINNVGKSLTEENLKYDKTADLLISIPLSENSLNIKLDYALINNNDEIVYNSKSGIGNYYLFTAGIVVGVICLIAIVNLIIYLNKIFGKKSEYEKTLDRLLRDYDRLIVESPTVVNDNRYNVIIVKSFEELLDVRDNLKMPIIFNEIKPRYESWFYIKEDNDLYLYVLSANKLGD